MKTKKSINEHDVKRPENKIPDLTIQEQINEFAEIIIEHLINKLYESRKINETT